jgi:phage gpG-like protein
MPADVSELLALSDDLKKSGAKIRRQVVKVVSDTTNSVEQDMQSGAPVGPTGDLRQSVKGSAKGLTGTVGTDIRYAVFVMYGSAHNPNPVDFLNPAADSAQTTFPPDVENAVIKALDL